MLKRTKQLEIPETSVLPTDFSDSLDSAERIGELLFEVVRIARVQKIDPEAALRATIRDYEAKVTALEAKDLT